MGSDGKGVRKLDLECVSERYCKISFYFGGGSKMKPFFLEIFSSFISLTVFILPSVPIGGQELKAPPHSMYMMTCF